MKAPESSDSFVEAAIADAVGRLEGRVESRGEGNNDVILAGRLARAGALVAEMAALRGALASANANMAELYAELEEAKEAVDGASHAKSQFLATMSHEIRTPIHGILGMIELLAGTSLEPGQKKMLETARRSAQSLLGLVGNALDMSKIEANRIELDCVDFDVSQVVEDVVGLCSATAAQKGLVLSSTMASGSARIVRGDGLRVRQVVSNLVGNAVKFTSAGRVDVSVSSVANEDGSVDLRIAVEDSGIGISPQVLARLFRPFVQADSSMARRFGGTGLGLAISRQLCRLMGGDLVATSEAGAGATFIATMKVGRPERASSDGSDCAVVVPPGTRILFVDDDGIHAAVARLVLESLGCSVLDASTGREACRLVLVEKVDAIFMECSLPDLSGFDAAREVRYLESCGALHGTGAGGRIPIVGLSGNGDPSATEAACVANGMDFMLPKPLTPAELGAALERALRPRPKP